MQSGGPRPFVVEAKDNTHSIADGMQQALGYAKTEVQSDGRIKKWAYIKEVDKFLRIILLDDGETVHNAFLIEILNGVE